MPGNTDAIRESIAKANVKAERKAKVDAKRSAILQAAQKQRAIEYLNLWRTGKYVAYHLLPYGIVGLRIVDGEVETSMGAKVPLDHARLGLRFVRKCRDTHTAYRRNGHTLHLGVYAIDEVDELGNLHAGCHHISIEEIERIAPFLEVAK